jgi:competence protein ComEC
MPVFRPLIPFLAFFIFGILSSARFPNYPWAALIAILLGTFWNIRRLVRKHSAGLSPLIFFFSLGYLSLLPWVNPYFPPHHVIHFTDTHPWEVTGTVSAVVQTTNNRKRLHLDVETLGHYSTTAMATGTVRLTILGPAAPLSAGDRISFVGRLKSIHNFNNPGGFDYRRYMAFKGIRAVAYARQENIKVLQPASNTGLRAGLAEERRRISGLIEKACEAAHQGVLKALVVGEKHAVSATLRETFNRAGVGHLLAISGLHMGIVAAASFFLCGWLLSRFKLFLWRAWTKKGAAVMSLLPVIFYGLLAGMSPSTQRAVIMVGVFLMTFIIEAEQDPMNTLAVAALAILAVFPASLFSISFQLSFSAVAAIIYGLDRIRRRRSAVGSAGRDNGWLRVRKNLTNFVLVSVFATLGTWPLVAFYFNQISLVGLLANLISVPIVGFVVVPAGLFAVFLSLFSSAAAVWIFKLTAGVLAVAIKSVTFFAGLPFAAVKIVTPTWLEIGCFYGLAWAILELATRRSETGKENGFLRGAPPNRTAFFQPRNFGRRILFTLKRLTSERPPVKLLLLGLVLVIAGDVFYWTYHRFWHDDLRVTIIDVGQGSSALLELPEGQCMLVDGGGFSNNATFDVGARIVAPFLWRKKIATVDTLVLSHANSDHLNGLLYIARHFNVKRVWCNHEPSESVVYQEFLSIIEQNGIHLPGFEKILKTRVVNNVHMAVLHPPIDFLEKKLAGTRRSINDNSLVLKVQYGRKAFLFPGDIMRNAESELVMTKKDLLRSDILIAPHHGSKTSSAANFIEAVDPEVVIVSAGWRNRFRFPAREVLARYEKHGSRVFRTDLHGAVSIATDGEYLAIKTFVDE